MQELITKIKEFYNIIQLMKSWCVQNSIDQPKILSYSIEKVLKLYDNFFGKYRTQQTSILNNQFSTEPIWFENQLILFQWTVITLSFTRQIYIKDFKKPQFEFLSSIFRNKQIYIIEYEIKILFIKGKQLRNAWTIEQQKILSEVINQINDKTKWNQIARQIYKISQGKYFRQGKHCRERWFSYIQNPKSQKEWSIEADIELLQLISVFGKRWCQLANKFTKSLSGLTIKKRYIKLISSIKNKTKQENSQKQAVSLLLKQKYEMIQNRKINMNLNKEKRINQTEKLQRCQKYVYNQPKSNEDSIKQSELLSNSKLIPYKYEKQVHPSINSNIEKQTQNNFDLNWIQTPGINFTYPEPTNNNLCHIGYFPMQCYTVVYPIIGQNIVENAKIYFQSPPYNIGENNFFY